MGRSENEIVSLNGTFSSSSRTNELFSLRRSSFGKYKVICGPTNGQYRPRLNPFIKTTPFLSQKKKSKFILINILCSYYQSNVPFPIHSYQYKYRKFHHSKYRM